MANPFEQVTVEALRERTSIKWRWFEPDVLPMWVAEMDVLPAPAITGAITEALGRGDTGYPHGHAYAEAFARFADDRWGASFDPGRTALVADVMQGAFELIRLLTRPGGQVIVTSPVYPPFHAYSEHAERTVLEAPLGDDLRLDVAAIEDACARVGEAGGVLLLCNPHNPTGTVLPREELLAISELVERRGGRVFADEIHAAIRYDGRVHVPYASVSEAAAGHTITGTSASKAWNIPGLKAAQLITSNEADEAVYRRFGFAVVHGASTLGVIASAAAYRDGDAWLAETVRYLQGNRDLLADLVAERLPQVRWRPPEATYLAWLDVAALELDGSPAEALRERAGVTLTDGALCGAGSEQHVRLVFATPAPVLEETVDRIAAALAPAGAAR